MRTGSEIDAATARYMNGLYYITAGDYTHAKNDFTTAENVFLHLKNDSMCAFCYVGVI